MNEIDTSLLDKAMHVAVDAHKNVARKGKMLPYSIHVMEAAVIVGTMSEDPELLAAAVLHDVVEDTDLTIEYVEKEFGHNVAQYVLTESDIKYDESGNKIPWHECKLDSINRLKAASRNEKIVALGDKLSNIRQIKRDYDVVGDEIWNIFSVKDKKEHAWRYMGLLDAFSELEGEAAYEEYKSLVLNVFGVNNELS